MKKTNTSATVLEEMDGSNFNSFKNLIESGYDINQTNLDGFNLLHIAVQKNNVEAVEFLLKQNININTKANEKNAIDFIISKDMIALFDIYYNDMDNELQKSFYFKRIEHL